MVSYETPYHLTVETKRKAVDVLNWGSAPFVRDSHGNLIPHGFTVKTFYKGKRFIASTRVVNPEGGKLPHAEYQFVSLEPPIEGQWNWTSSGALQNVLDKLGNRVKCVRGTNGALQIGVTYPNVQAVLRRVFSSVPAASDAVPQLAPAKRELMRSSPQPMKQETEAPPAAVKQEPATPPPAPAAPSEPPAAETKEQEEEEELQKPQLVSQVSQATLSTTPYEYSSRQQQQQDEFAFPTIIEDFDLWRDLDSDFLLMEPHEAHYSLEADDLQPKPPELFANPFEDSNAELTSSSCCFPSDSTPQV